MNSRMLTREQFEETRVMSLLFFGGAKSVLVNDPPQGLLGPRVSKFVNKLFKDLDYNPLQREGLIRSCIYSFINKLFGLDRSNNLLDNNISYHLENLKKNTYEDYVARESKIEDTIRKHESEIEKLGESKDTQITYKEFDTIVGGAITVDDYALRCGGVTGGKGLWTEKKYNEKMNEMRNQIFAR